MQKISVYLLLCCTLLLTNLKTFGQTITFQAGEESKGDAEYEYSVPIDGGFLILRTDKSRGFMAAREKVSTALLVVDNNLNVKQEVPFSVPNADYIGIHGLQKLGNKCYFFYSKREKRSDETAFCGLEINVQDIMKSREWIMGRFSFEKNPPVFSLKISMDSTACLLFVEPSQKKKEMQQFYFAVFDNDLQKVWDKNVSLDVESRFLDLFGATCRGKDNVYVNYKHYTDEIKRESVRDNDGSRIPSYTTNLLCFEKGKDQPTEVRIDLGDKFVHSSELIYNTKNGLIEIAGMYKNKHNGNVNGIFHAQLDPIANTFKKSPQTTAFPYEMLEMLKKDRFASKKESDPGLFIPFTGIDPLVRGDGSIDYLMEYRLVQLITVSSGRSTYSYIQYTYGSIVNAHIKDGSVFFTRIPKYQIQTNGNQLLSFYPIEYQNKLLLLYNDDKDNAEKSIEKAPDAIQNFKKSVMMAAIIDEEGKLNRNIITDVKSSENFITNFKLMEKITPNTYSITQYRLKGSMHTRFGTLTIE
jgi:hypothetical protein